jgi:hypothetical protein
MTPAVVLRALACAVLVVLAAATPAHATGSIKKAIWGPVEVGGVSQFPIYRDLGVGIYQQDISWAAVTQRGRPANPRDPDDPAYAWPEVIDRAVAEARRYGIRLSLMVWRTPDWANGGRGVTAPPSRAADYADFIEAVSRRYPTVRFWMVWGEPIRAVNYLLHPTGSPNYYRKDCGGVCRPRPFNAVQRRDAMRYAQLVDAAYGRLKSLDRRHRIIGGNTTTSGDVDPENWIKNLRLPDGRPPRMDLFGHNPFTSRMPDLRRKQILPGTADFSDLDTLAGWLDRYLHRGERNRRLRIFISEFTMPTDVPGYEFPFHATRAAQARVLSAGLRIARRWNRIFTFGWMGLRDVEPRADGTESRTGLIDRQGRRKPAYYAYKRG